MKPRSYPSSEIVIVLLFSITGITACNNEEMHSSPGKKDSLHGVTSVAASSVLDKLVGTWKNEDANNFERWTRTADGSFQSVVFDVKAKDTAYNERAEVYQENGKWIFENAVRDQNGGKAVRFIADTITERTVQFSNSSHDFPNDINYTVPDDHTLRAFIAGKNEKGGRDTVRFNYKREEK